MVIAQKPGMTMRESNEALSKAFLESYRRGDWRACGAPYAEDATFTIPGGQVFRGRAAIAEGFKGQIEAGVTVDGYEVIKTVEGADVGYVVQRWWGSAADNIFIYGMRKGADDIWMITDELGTPAK
jgi:ketosteroid isomerase-like protein